MWRPLAAAIMLTAATGHPVAADDLGAYLASECVTCHQQDGSDQGIASIRHWPVEDFIAAMQAYKQKQRPHQVMQILAGRLSDAEIAALAAYFSTID